MEPAHQVHVGFGDCDLQSRVQSFLRSRHFATFQELNVGVENGAVTISGEVQSFYEKQVAMDSCRRVAGVLSLIDEIDVSRNQFSRISPK